jgi:hypothetical protein
VFTVGGIKDAALAEEILAAGKADMVAMTRAQIADPSSRTRRARAARTRSSTASAATRAASAASSRACRSLHRQPRAGREGGSAARCPPRSPARWLVAAAARPG